MANEHILIADDDKAIRTVLDTALTRAGFKVTLTENASGLWDYSQQDLADLIITDVVMPDENAFDLIPKIKKSKPNIPIIVMSAKNTLMTAITANKLGVFDYLPKPFDIKELVNIVNRALSDKKKAIIKNNSDINSETFPLIGRSKSMQEIYRVMARLMSSDLTVMITGESGTGKELIAKALHEFGSRKNGPFIAINMAAIPKDLIESELFGHEKGSFTGAIEKKVGKFQLADRGTLFLDEIGDMPLDAQTRLLRVIQEGEFISVGGTVPTKTNVRIIAATNKSLSDQIKQGAFREDLYYRINVIPINLPPLRDRKEDIPALINHFLFNEVDDKQKISRDFDEESINLLLDYSWPGNIRELKNFINRIITLYPNKLIDSSIVRNELSSLEKKIIIENDNLRSLSDFVEKYLNTFPTEEFKEFENDLYYRILADFEKPLIEHVMKITNGNQIKAANILGLNRNTLRKKIGQLKINYSRI